MGMREGEKGVPFGVEVPECGGEGVVKEDRGCVMVDERGGEVMVAFGLEVVLVEKFVVEITVTGAFMA